MFRPGESIGDYRLDPPEPPESTYEDDSDDYYETCWRCGKSNDTVEQCAECGDYYCDKCRSEQLVDCTKIPESECVCSTECAAEYWQARREAISEARRAVAMQGRATG